jgi:Mlc titration factor MtfA (ptsG expression regulator)
MIDVLADAAALFRSSLPALHSCLSSIHQHKKSKHFQRDITNAYNTVCNRCNVHDEIARRIALCFPQPVLEAHVESIPQLLKVLSKTPPSPELSLSKPYLMDGLHGAERTNL